MEDITGKDYVSSPMPYFLMLPQWVNINPLFMANSACFNNYIQTADVFRLCCVLL